MVNPVSASHAAAHSGYEVQQAATKLPQPAQHSTSMPQDKVTIKSKGDNADHDGDRK